MARVFHFILKTKHKTLHVKRAWAELENSAEKHYAQVSIDREFCLSFDRSRMILDRSNQTELHNKLCCNSIPTLHKTHTL